MSYLNIPDDIRQLMITGRKEFPELFWAIDLDGDLDMDNIRSNMKEQLRKARAERDNKQE